ncbi:MAG: response regulator [bacterium]|nr:response regulator [bacterium]
MAKILLVEDDINLRDIYYARFEAEGYQISVASNGEEALAAAVKERPDVILLDIMMPRISGFDVLDIIRSTPEIAHTKVIMMTALSEESDRERGKKLGVDEYLVKSQVTLEEVVDTVKRVLGEPAKNNPVPEKS